MGVRSPTSVGSLTILYPVIDKRTTDFTSDIVDELLLSKSYIFLKFLKSYFTTSKEQKKKKIIIIITQVYGYGYGNTLILKHSIYEEMHFTKKRQNFCS